MIFIADFIINLIHKLFFRKNNNNNKKNEILNFFNGTIISFFIISIRKIIVLLCWINITPEDNDSINSKAFLLYSFMNILQQWFIIKTINLNDNNTTTNNNNNTNFKSIFKFSKNSVLNTLNSFYKLPKNTKNFNKAFKLKFKIKRNICFLISIFLNFLLLIIMYKHFIEESLGNDDFFHHPFWFYLIKPLQLLTLYFDLEFTNTLILEISYLNFNFKNLIFGSNENHYLV